MKGISEIVAMLLMLVITIGLVGTVAYFLFGVTKRGAFEIQQINCTAGSNTQIKMSAIYTGADAVPQDVVIRVKTTRGWATVSNFTIYKGTNCDKLENIGQGQQNCGVAASGTNPISSGDRVGIISNTGISTSDNEKIDVQIVVFGQPSAIKSVNCYT